jgi:hypothetical protein
VVEVAGDGVGGLGDRPADGVARRAGDDVARSGVRASNRGIGGIPDAHAVVSVAEGGASVDVSAERLPNTLVFVEE